MSRSRLKTDPITLLNALIVCLREEIAACQWRQAGDRLDHMRTIVMHAAIDEDSQLRAD